jgi:hypothetical protein
MDRLQSFSLPRLLCNPLAFNQWMTWSIGKFGSLDLDEAQYEGA